MTTVSTCKAIWRRKQVSSSSCPHVGYLNDYNRCLSGFSEFRIVRLAKSLSKNFEKDKCKIWIAEERRNFARLLGEARTKVANGYSLYRHIRPGKKAGALLAEYSKQVETMRS